MRASPKAGRSFLLVALPVALLVAPIVLPPTPAKAADEEAPAERIASTIESMRGLTLKGLKEPERKALFHRLDQKWTILLGEPEIARGAVREVLEKEQKDSFLIIELTHLMMFLDRDLKSAHDMTGWLLKADPNAYPPAFFDIVSAMAARHCQDCLPAALKMLELHGLDAYIPAHALPVDLELGLIFTIGQYGDAAIHEVQARLESKDCDVRGNAALMLGYLQPNSMPAAIERMALEDSCASARAKAWNSLGMFSDPAVATLVQKRLAAKPAPKPEEKIGIVHALSSATEPEAKKLLKDFQSDPDPDVARSARVARDMRRGGAAGRQGEGQSGGSPPTRRKALALLDKAARRGRFDAETDPAAFAAALALEDLPALNKARAAVLARLSDECLDEYFVLTRTAHDLRERALAGAGPGRKSEPPGGQRRE